MGKVFLYGQTLEKDITDLFAKLTVHCEIGMLVRVKSVDSGIAYESITNGSGVATFESITPGYWDITVVDVDNPPVRRIYIDGLEYTVEIDYITATIDITYPVGSICTVSNGDMTYTAPDMNGVWACTVIGSGYWTITSVKDDLSDSEIVNITADGEIANVALRYFEATIDIAYPEGSICTVSNGVKTYVAPDTSGSWSCVVNYPGTCVVSCSDGDQIKETVVVVTTDGQKDSVILTYFEAIINIAYTEGSTCTCSYGSTTYTSPDTSGNWTCVVPFAGTWLVTVTDGVSSKTDTVTITEDGQSVDVNVMLFEAYITVTYPEGSTCSCSNGVNILTAPDTSGNYTFVVPHAGSWEVSCQDLNSGKSVNDTVDIISDGQTENITLHYILYLYKDGILGQNSSGITFSVGKADDTGTSRISKTSSNMTWTCGDNSWCIFYISPKIICSGYSYLKISITGASMNLDGDGIDWGLSKSVNYEGTGFVSRTNVSSFSGAKTISLDVSKVDNTECYVAMQFGTAGSYGYFNATITSIWFE